MKREEKVFLGLLTIFLTVLLMANILAIKKIEIFGIVATGGIFAYPLTFLITDIMVETWGRARAQITVWLGLGASILMVLYILLVQNIPPAEFWVYQDAYDKILGGTFRIVLASMVAYLAAQTLDIWTFQALKIKTQGKYLWIRNNVSTMTSQGIDTIIFVMIAFFGVLPNSVVFQIGLSTYLLKLLIAALDTPFCYLGVAIVKRAIREEQS